MKSQFQIVKTFLHVAVVLSASAWMTAASAQAIADSGDINNDGIEDVAVVTAPTTITVYLANPDGSHTVSAILSAPKNRPISSFYLYDLNGDGALDVFASSPGGGDWVYLHLWYGNGDGTFGARTTQKWSWPPKGHPHGSW